MIYGTRYEHAPPTLRATGYQDWTDPALDRVVHEHGMCAQQSSPRCGADQYYPEPHQVKAGPERETQARAACRGCPVTMACLERGLRYEADARTCWGIWGAVSTKRRRVILRDADWIWPRPATITAPKDGVGTQQPQPEETTPFPEGTDTVTAA
ncbi:WhiB family transcriptional regulator [Saccharopolyspora griseoalba]|uniref:WhiB family transcriptional regulator n=1 Tax=Saccharopolyspora griseoalba TaxID=1431848 RepID=A0ABW2LTS5_9PSEU